MPYATRKMVQYMKENGISSADGSSSSGSNTVVSGASSATSAVSGKKKIRELPSSIDPVDEDDKKSVVSGDAAKSKSKASVAKSSSATTSKSASGTGAKAASSSSKTKAKSEDATSKPASSTKAKSANKKSSSSQSIKASKSASSEGGGKGGKASKVVIPASAMALKPVMVSGMNYDEMSFDQKRVQFIQTLLKSNVRKLKELSASEPFEGAKKQFGNYTIDEKKPLERKAHSAKALYECNHKSFPKECLMVCKVYDGKVAAYDPKKSLFFQILRHLGKKHPNIMQTWDIISKESSVYVFQELAPYGNMTDYMAKNGGALKEEDQVVEIGRQIRTGMDFLGDMGVAHRSINPGHILVMHKDMRVKLTGFRSAIIYYEEKKDDINYQPCLPLDKKGKTEDYQAPEVYGSARTEEYDPIAADTWSFGATMYKIVSGKYPYDNSNENAKIESEIQGNVRGLKVSDNGKSALGLMLTVESTKRLSIEKLKEHPWFKEK